MLQLFFCIVILMLNLGVYWLLGKAACIKCRLHPVLAEVVCIGFFAYFALFQIVAEIMIFTKQKLHVLGYVWLALLIVVLAVCAWIVKKGRVPQTAVYSPSVRPSRATRMLLALMAAAIVCECVTAVLLQRNIGWDFAYYIGNMTTSVATDTMYLYDGNSGLIRETMELRYALSSFYMNTAWMSQITGISALLLQKYVMGVLCVLLANAVVYSFAMEVFQRDRKKSSVLVTLTILLTLFWDVYDTSGQFLMLRGYEAKAYCANVVLPMAFYLLYRIWKKDYDLRNWAELFLISCASVAISMSSLVIVPVMTAIMLLAHMVVEKRRDMGFIRKAIYCLLPNVCYMLVYFCYEMEWLVVEV